MAMLPTNVAGGQTGRIAHVNQIHRKLNLQSVDVSADYGGSGDLVDDDTAEVQAAINATPTHGTLVFSGRYKVTGSLVLPRPMRWLGAGFRDGIYARGANFYLVDPTNIDGFIVENMTFDGDYPTRTSGSFLPMSGCTNVIVERSRFLNIPEGAVGFTNCKRCWVSTSRFENIKASGVRVNDPGAGLANRDIWIEDNYFLDCQAGRIAGNAAVQSSGGSGGVNERLFIHRNYVKIPGLDGVGIGLDFANYSDIIGNKVQGAPPQTPDGNGENIVATGRFNRVIDNDSWNAGGSSGIMLFATGAQSGAYDCQGSLVQGNRCWDNNGAGIAITSWTNNLVLKDIAIIDNHCWNTGLRTGGDAQDFGFQEYPGPGVTGVTYSACRLQNNNFVGNGNAAGYSTAAPTAGLLRHANLITATTMDQTVPTMA